MTHALGTPCILTPPHPLAGTRCTFIAARPGTGTAVYIVRLDEGELAGVELPVFPEVVELSEEPHAP